MWRLWIALRHIYREARCGFRVRAVILERAQSTPARHVLCVPSAPFLRGARDGELCFVCELGLKLLDRFVWALVVVGLDGFLATRPVGLQNSEFHACRVEFNVSDFSRTIDNNSNLATNTK